MVLAKLILISQLLLAHEFYDPACCSDKDCRPVTCNEIVAQPDGTVKYKDFTFNKRMFKTAPDGMCHVCIWGNTPMCVYFPAGS